MALRVLRILEYQYEDEETAERDMAQWTPTIQTSSMKMRSTTLPFEAIEWEKEQDG